MLTSFTVLRLLLLLCWAETQALNSVRGCVCVEDETSFAIALMTKNGRDQVGKGEAKSGWPIVPSIIVDAVLYEKRSGLRRASAVCLLFVGFRCGRGGRGDNSNPLCFKSLMGPFFLV